MAAKIGSGSKTIFVLYHLFAIEILATLLAKIVSLNPHLCEKKRYQHLCGFVFCVICGYDST